MKRMVKTFFVPAFFILMVVSVSAQKKTRASVEQAMKNYDHFIQKMDVDSLALVYAPDGELGDMARGRDSIRHFLDKFKSFRVLSQNSSTDSLSIHEDSAYQHGLYHQTVIIPPTDTVFVKGYYTARWIWISKKGWFLKRMETLPLK